MPKKKTIVIDAREACRPQRDGKGNYIFAILRELAKKRDNQQQISILIAAGQTVPIAIPENWRIHKVTARGFFWQLKAALLIRKRYADAVLFSPTSFILPLLIKNKAVVTIHDLIALRYKDTHHKKAVRIESICLPLLIKQKRIHFSCVSQTTAADLQQYFPQFGTQQNRIHIHKLGLGDHVQDFAAQELDREHRKQPYILNVGTVIPRKNTAFLIRVFSRLKASEASFKDVQLHLVGAKGWQTTDVEAAYSQSDYQSDIVVHGFVSDQKLAQLYQNADLCVFPSKYEGFGLPLLEAMYYQVPLVISDASCFPEIAGEAAVYFDPTDESTASGSAYQQILEVFSNKELQADLKGKGQKQLQRYSYAQTTHELQQLFEQL